MTLGDVKKNIDVLAKSLMILSSHINERMVDMGLDH